MKNSNDLRETLRRIDHRGYPAYKDTRGSYKFTTPGGAAYELNIEHVQGDPFAAPSSLSVIVRGRAAGFPVNLYDRPYKADAFCDFLLRGFSQALTRISSRAGSGKSGSFGATRCGQEILRRSGCAVDAGSATSQAAGSRAGSATSAAGDIIVRFEAGFPARGRTIDARALERMLFQELPSVIEQTLLWRTCRQKAMIAQIQLAEDRQFMMEELDRQGLVAFIADGSILPRESGVSQRPMKDAIPFVSPESMAVTLDLPHRGQIRGMVIPQGITLIAGGGYHGKSTLLKALETAVYPHIPGDGREYIATVSDAMKIRAEDGRRIEGTDISMFIRDLPNGKDTAFFCTEDASGSTSQAANVVEAMEAGCTAFLIDEDTSATNFMVRDDLMQEVIHPDHEPITPFLERIRTLYEECGISTIIVAGSSGAFFREADHVIQMDRYEPVDITQRAKQAAAAHPISEAAATAARQVPEFREPSFRRAPLPVKDLRYKGRIKLKTNGTDGVMIAKENIDLRYLEQLVTSQQLTCLGKIAGRLLDSECDGRLTLQQLVDRFYHQLQTQGFSALQDSTGDRRGSGNRAGSADPLALGIPAHLTMPRKQEVYGCLNRFRRLKLNR